MQCQSNYKLYQYLYHDQIQLLIRKLYLRKFFVSLSVIIRLQHHKTEECKTKLTFKQNNGVSQLVMQLSQLLKGCGKLKLSFCFGVLCSLINFCLKIIRSQYVSSRYVESRSFGNSLSWMVDVSRKRPSFRHVLK